MNRQYRLVWQARTKQWVAVSELARVRAPSKGGASARNRTVWVLGCLVLGWASAWAAGPTPTQLPQGGQVVAGQASLSQSAAVLNVNQTSQRAAIDWQSFNVGAAAQVNFNQPSRASVTLNRVLDPNPSQIFGRINAPGQVFLVNPAGVYFAPSASVEVGGLMASTHQLSNEDFMAGRYTLTRNGAMGSVLNEGQLSAARDGYVALLAPEVRNQGVVVAKMGTVVLAAGEAYTLQFDGQGLLSNVVVTAATMKALVENGNAVQAPGGLIILSAQAASRLQGGAVNNTGSLQANGLVKEGGRIMLRASDQIRHSGVVQADAAPDSAAQGGHITLIADLSNPHSMTTVSGSLSAKAGNLGGDGGFVETSASLLDIAAAARIDTSAPKGQAGEWLLDPVDITIDASSGNNNYSPTSASSVVSASSIVSSLNAGTSVTITTANGTGGNGDITVSSAIAKTGNNTSTLTLTAARNIAVNAEISSSNNTLGLTLNAGGNTSGSGAINTNGGLLSLSPGSGTGTYSGVISGTGGVTKAGSGTLTLSGANTYTGATTVSAGVLKAGVASVSGVSGAFGVGSAVTLSNTAGASLDTTGFANQIGSLAGGGTTGGNLTLGSAVLTVGDASSTNYAGVISGGLSGGLVKTGSGTLTISGNNTYTGATTVNAGTLSIASATGLGTTNTGTTVNAGATLEISGVTAADNVSLNGGILKGGVGTATLSGTLSLGVSAGTVDSSGSTLTLNGAINPAGRTVTFTGTGDTIVNGVIGSGAVTKTGSGTLTLTASNTYTSPTTLSGGVLSVSTLGNGGANSGIGRSSNSASNLILDGGTLQYTGATVSTDRRLTLTGNGGGIDASGTGALTFSNTAAISYSGLGARTLTLSGSQTASNTLNLVLGDNGGATSLTKTGSGTWVLGGGNTYTGATSVSAGALKAGVASVAGVSGAFGVGSAVTLSDTSGALLNITGYNTQVGSLAGGGTTGGNVVLGAATLTVGDSNSTSFGGVISGTGGITKTGSGTLTLSGVNTFDGLATISQGTLATTSTGRLDNSATVKVASPGTFALGADDEIASLQEDTGSVGNVVLTGTLRVGGNGSSSFSGVISGVGGLTKAGTGTWTLSGNNTYSGPTRVASGTLSVSSLGNIGTGTSNLGQPTAGTDRLSVEGGVLQYTGTSSVSNRNFSLLSVTQSTIEVTNAAATLTLSGASASTDGGWIKTGAGTLILAGDNLYSGTTTVNAGTLQIGNGGTTGSLGSGAVTNNASLVYNRSASTTLSNAISGSGSLTATISGVSQALNMNGAVSLSGAVDLQASGDLTVGANISSGASSTLVAGGTLTLSSATTTALSAGNLTLRAGRFVNNSNSSALSVSGGGSWQVWSSNSDPFNTNASLADVRGGLSYNFKQYNASFGATAVAGSGNGFLYTYAPTVSGALTGTVTKVYNGDTAATLTAGNYSVSGNVDGDVVVLSQPGSGTYTSAGTGLGVKDVGAGKTVSVTGVSVVSATNGVATLYGYGLSSSTVTGSVGEITAKGLTVTGTTVANKVYDGTTTATLSNGSLVGVLAADAANVSLTQAGTFADKNVGAAKVVTAANSLSGTESSNYSLTQPTGLSADITAKALTVTGTTVANKVYDGITTATVSNGSLVGVVAADAANVSLTQAGTFADKNVGTAKVVTAANSLSGTESGNYSLTQPTGLSADITAKALTVSGTTVANKVYDGTTTATLSNGSLVGVLAADAANVSLTQAGTFADKNVGTAKVVTAANSLSGTESGNYSLTQPTGLSADITAKALTVTGTTVANKVYDGTTAATLSNGSLVGVVAADLTNVSLTQAGTFADKNVGAAKVVTAANSLSGTESGNYSLTQPTGLSADITAKALTVSGTTVADKVYDGTTTAAISNGTLVGVVAADAANVSLTQAGTFADKNVGAAKVVTAANSLSGTESGNYSLTQPTGLSADITAKALTVTGTTVANKVYDGTTTATVSNGSLVGVVAADAANVSLTQAGTFSDKNVGAAKVVTAANSLSGTESGNYSLTQPTGLSADITAKALTVSGTTVANKVYDGTTAATLSNGSLVGVVAADLANVSLTQAGTFADKNVGTAKVVTAANSLSGTESGNYSLTQPTGLSADITAKALTVTGTTVANKVYDGTTAATLSNGSLVGVVAADLTNVSLTQAGTFADKNVGAAKVVTAANSLSGTESGNYSLTQPTGLSADITAKALTVSGTTVADKVYDGTTTAALSNGTLVGVVAADAANVSLTQAGTFADKNVGTAKVVTAANSLSGTESSNYSLTQPTGLSADITAKALTVSGTTVANKVYDGTTAATLSNGSLVGVVAADLANVSLTQAGTFADKNVGTAKVVTAANSISGTDSGNYSLTQPTGLSADITAKALTVSGTTVADKVYDGTTTAALSNGTLVGVVAAYAANVSLTQAGTFADKNVGTAKVVTAANSLSGTESDNYSLIQPTGLSADITAKALAVSGTTVANKVYDGTTTATLNNGSLVGVVVADLANVSLTQAGTFADKNVGAAKVVTAANSLSGTESGNYSLTQPTGLSADITAKALTVTGTTVANKVYDGTTTATVSNGSLVGVVAADAANVSLTQAGTFSDKNVGAAKVVTAANSLSGTESSNYSLTQPTGLSADITAKALTVTGTTVANKVYDGTTAATLSNGSLVGVVAADLANVSLTQAGTFADKNVGTAKVVTAANSLSGTESGNYSLTQPTGLNADITTQILVVKANDHRKAYDGRPYVGGPGVTYEGFAGNEAEQVLRGVLSYQGNSQGAVTPGQYTIAPTGWLSDNYSIHYIDGQLTVTAPRVAFSERVMTTPVPPRAVVPLAAADLHSSFYARLWIVSYPRDAAAGVATLEVYPPRLDNETMLHIPIPREIAGTGIASVNTNSLPTWLHFDATQQIFTATAIPNDIESVQVNLHIKEVHWLLTLDLRQARQRKGYAHAK